MTRERFHASFCSLLDELRPDLDVAAPSGDTHLWTAGHLDSLALLEVVLWLEDTYDVRIDTTVDFLPNFFTIDRIYDTYLADVDATSAITVAR